MLAKLDSYKTRMGVLEAVSDEIHDNSLNRTGQSAEFPITGLDMYYYSN
jgi:hypothetical protein